MRDPSSSVRYLGYRPMPNGSRRLDFSFVRQDQSVRFISVDASKDLFIGPEHMAIQECVGICYETLKFRVAGCSDELPNSINLTPTDVAQHRHQGKTSSSRRKR